MLWLLLYLYGITVSGIVIRVVALAVVAGVVRCYLKQTVVGIEDLCCYYIAD